MAAQTGACAFHGTLVAATLDTVTLNFGYREVEVLNRAAVGGAEIYFTVNGNTPTVGGTNAYVVLPTQALRIVCPTTPGIVRLISTGTPAYSVSGFGGA